MRRRPPTPPPMPRYLPLNKQSHIAEELARVYRLYKDGKVDDRFARTTTYTLEAMSRVLKEGDLEARIEALEAAAKGGTFDSHDA